MFFKDTFKRFFDEKLIFIILTISALAYLLLKLLIEAEGLIFLFYFSISLLTSLIFREACLTDEIYFEDKKKLNKKNILSYILSKNLFVIFLTSMLVSLVFLLSFLLKYKIVNIKDFFDILILILATLASENIVLLFYNKPIFTEYPRPLIGDKYIGLTYFKSMIPSILIDLLIGMVFTKYSLKYLFIFCYFISIIIFYIRVKNRGLYD
ncbi:hypothetical protein ANHYDRO_01344 [Anaerococcus hydrogenalis DSM 7454]|uniref:Uncharacterized protein n=1 Tax=Anaerococcus hydrogenalis DSM 7454 TaxID=561177 RepID=B6W9R9_9FIRM|nr:hypothetical protein [Anaerococcus hydrogenalis]EEB35833.1 hypothetical protein ANHYDRO_01344 [Anaerococcus hydrogenalis DSM 7454]